MPQSLNPLARAASPTRTPGVMKGHEIQRALRLITAPDWKRHGRFPIAVIAQLAGVDRTLVYLLRDGQCLTGRVLECLSPVLEDILAGKLKAERRGRRWMVRSVENPEMGERRFFGRTEDWRNWRPG